MKQTHRLTVVFVLLFSLFSGVLQSVRPAEAESWTGWTTLGGILTDSPAAASFNGRVYVFAKGSDDALYVKSSADGVNFTDWTNLGGILTAAPAAASANERLYVFAKGSDNALYIKSSADGTTFTDWLNLGGILTAPPAAASLNNVLYVFAKGSDNALYEKHAADGVNFTDWRSLGGILTAAPAAVGFQGRILVFAKGSDNALYEKDSTDGVAWTEWRNLGGILTAAPAAAAYTPVASGSVLYSFAKGTDNALYERHTNDGVNWTAWVSLCGELIGPPAAAGLGGTLFAFVRWTDNSLWERHTTPGTPGSCNQQIPPPSSTILVRNSTSYTSSSFRYVVGEVVNTGSRPVWSVKVGAKFFDANNQIVAVADTYTSLDQTDPSATNPFKIIVSNAPTSITRYELTTSWSTTSYLEYRPATVLSQGTRNNYGVEVFGEVRNDNARELRGVEIAVTFYDAAGNVIATDTGYPSSSSLLPGTSSIYRVSTYRTFTYATYRVQAQGYLAP